MISKKGDFLFMHMRRDLTRGFDICFFLKYVCEF